MSGRTLISDNQRVWLRHFLVCNGYDQNWCNQRGDKIILENVKMQAKRLQGFRLGTEVDAEALSKMFLGFDYVVKPIHRNLTAAQLRQTLKDLAKEKGPNGESIFQGYASLVVCLLSHGGLGTVCGVDNEEVNVVQLQYEIFNSESCPDLSDKPKIFIIQACQGDRMILHDPMKKAEKQGKQDDGSSVQSGPSQTNTSPTHPAPLAPGIHFLMFDVYFCLI